MNGGLAGRLRSSTAPGVVVDRATPGDRAFWAMDVGPVPQQLGVVLRLESADRVDLALVRRLVAERISVVPRLRQRLEKVPFGCGGPVWVDAADFDIADHVGEIACLRPGDDQALWDTALDVVATPLPKDAPLWSVRLVTSLAAGGAALVVTLHHVIADGQGGLAVLACLLDPGPEAGPRRGSASDGARFPRSRPGAGALAVDALTRRLRALRGMRGSWSQLRASFGAGGGLRPPRIADCSLTRPTGPRRAVAVVPVSLRELRDTAHRQGATTNDAVLVAVGGALGQVLRTRGERVGTLVVAVPVSGRRQGDAVLGNLASPMLVPVPTAGDVGDRLATVAAQVRARRSDATGPPPIALLGWAFRPLAALGGYRWYLDHQRRFHTLVSHVRGPTDAVSFAGVRVTDAVPLAVGEAGNSTAYAEVLSYAGRLTISVIVDPEHFADLDVLAAELRSELTGMAMAGAAAG